MVALALGLCLLLASTVGVVGLTVIALELSGVAVAIVTGIALLNLLAVILGLAARRRKRGAESGWLSDPLPSERRHGRIIARERNDDLFPIDPEAHDAEIRIADRR
jgi:hypothetical protein